MRDDDPLDPELARYVDALRAIDTPSPRARDNNLAAVRARVDPPRRHRVAIAAAVLAAAAIIAIALTTDARRATRADDPPSRPQAPYEGEADAATGSIEAVHERTRASDPDAPEHAPHDADAASGPAQTGSDEPIAADASPPDSAGSTATTARRPARAETKAEAEASSLAEEIAAFAPVREALKTQRLHDALAALDRYDRAFPKGAFRAESQLSRVTVLCELGKTAEAIRLREAFLRRHPGSHLAPHMRSACPDAN